MCNVCAVEATAARNLPPEPLPIETLVDDQQPMTPEIQACVDKALQEELSGNLPPEAQTDSTEGGDATCREQESEPANSPASNAAAGVQPSGDAAEPGAAEPQGAAECAYYAAMLQSVSWRGIKAIQDAIDAATAQERQKVEELTRENTKLREIISAHVATTGSSCAPDASMDFIAATPENTRKRIARLWQEIADAKKQLEEARAELAEEKRAYADSDANYDRVVMDKIQLRAELEAAKRERDEARNQVSADDAARRNRAGK